MNNRSKFEFFCVERYKYVQYTKCFTEGTLGDQNKNVIKNVCSKLRKTRKKRGKKRHFFTIAKLSWFELHDTFTD